jgi:AraC-like DNA-binding protein
MDALSDVLRAVRLTGAVFFDIHACEPWVAQTPSGSSIVRRIFPQAEHLIPYHAIIRGSCWAGVLGQQPLHLTDGDFILFPAGHAHVLSSAPGMHSAPDRGLYRQPTQGQLPFSISLGTAPSAGAHIICGYLGCDARPYNPLLAALPNAIRVSDESGGTLRNLMQLAMAESQAQRIGGECALARLSELMFVEVLRRHVETLPADRQDWLSGLRDPSVGRAITALHRDPARDWTVRSLARESRVSRSILAERFTRFAGCPPMQYLANWRIQLAADALRGGNETVLSIANRVGYESEAAFSRAFKKAVGKPPSAWRKLGPGKS